MKQSVKIFLLVIIAIAAIAITFVISGSNKAPEVSFTDIDGKSHQLSDYQGDPLLLIFWATDCPGCIQEMPELIALHKEYQNTAFKMIGIAMPHDNPDHIQAMRSQKQLPYIITWDKTGSFGEAFNNVLVTPTHFLISPEGEIVMRKIGTMNIDLLKQKLAMMGITANNS